MSLCGEILQVDGDSWTCTKPAPCYTQHVAHGMVVWDNPRRPAPKTSKKRKATLDVVAAATPASRTAQDVIDEQVASTLTERERVAQAQAEGMTAAANAAGAQFAAEALRSVKSLAERLPNLTTDDVWADLAVRGISTEHKGAIGSVMQTAARNHWIRKTGMMSTTDRPDQRAHGLSIWESMLYSKV